MNEIANHNGNHEPMTLLKESIVRGSFHSRPLYNGHSLRLTPMNIEKDAPVIAGWTYQPEVTPQLTFGRSTPMTPIEVRKVMENWKKDIENSGHTFIFSLRPLEEERIIGLIVIAYVQWVHAAGQIRLVIGDQLDWDHFAREALQMALNYAFDELNLFRVSLRVGEDEIPARALFQQAELTLEVRQRQAIFRNGSYQDGLSFGILRTEWQAAHAAEEAK